MNIHCIHNSFTNVGLSCEIMNKEDQDSMDVFMILVCLRYKINRKVANATNCVQKWNWQAFAIIITSINQV